jgi:hypothetical protein
VIVASPVRWALMHELRGAPEPPLDDLLAHLAPVDLVLIEGYKRAPHPKIEAHRPETGQALLAPENPSIRAVASTAPSGHPALAGLSVPLLPLDDTRAIADFILHEVGLAEPWHELDRDRRRRLVRRSGPKTGRDSIWMGIAEGERVESENPATRRG